MAAVVKSAPNYYSLKNSPREGRLGEEPDSRESGPGNLPLKTNSGQLAGWMQRNDVLVVEVRIEETAGWLEKME
jgi:hypothetical protein